MTESRYFRYPNLRGDLLTFVADDDVWLAPAGGGRAWRISADQAPAAYPRFSADGTLVAWTSWRDGPPEIYLAGTEGGEAARVSYWSNLTTQVRGWSPDGEILATTAREQPFPHSTWAYAIPVSDGAGAFAAHRRLPFGPVGRRRHRTARPPRCSPRPSTRTRRSGSGTGGGRPAGCGSPTGAARGAVTGGRRSAGSWPTCAGQFFSPMLVGGRLAFISDHEGIGNIYSCALDGTDLRRHTDHDDFYARNASTDGTRIVYQCGGDLWLLADLSPDSEPVRLDVSLGARRPAARRS